MRGYEHAYEFIADAIEYPLAFMRLGKRVFELYAPEIREYWADIHFGSDLRQRLTDSLQRAMKRDGSLCLLGHSLGTMLCYDVLWKMSHYSEYRHAAWPRPVELWITMGGPLADETIHEHLKDAIAPEKFRYPTNAVRWVNIDAEDDLIAHDQKVGNDFRPMRRQGCQITDYRIFNPAMRKGRLNPHEGVGYLIHPRTVKVLAQWLESKE